MGAVPAPSDDNALLSADEARILEAFRQGGPAPPDNALPSSLARACFTAMAQAEPGNRDGALNDFLSGLSPEQAAAIQTALMDVGAEPDDWPAPVDIPPATTVPTMGAELLPADLRPHIKDCADRPKVPYEYIAMPAIAAAGGLIGRQLAIQPSPFDRFYVVPNVWALIVGPPGWMKSTALDYGVQAVNDLQREARREYGARGLDLRAAQDRRDEEISSLKSRLKKAVKDGTDVGSIEAQLRAKYEEQEAADADQAPLLITQDATIEALGKLLVANPRGIIIHRDEMAGLFADLARSDRGSQRQFLLQGWDGKGAYIFNRISRDEVECIPTLTLIGGIQPGPLQAKVAAAVAGRDEADGLLQRFQLLVWPDDLPHYAHATRYAEDVTYQVARAIYKGLMDLDVERIGAARIGFADTQDSIPVLRFDPDAQRMFDGWRDALEDRVRGPELQDSPAFCAHICKYRSLVPSLALIFHLIQRRAGPVSPEPLHLALKWAEFLEAHARKVYSAELSPGTDVAHALLAKMRRGAIYDGMRLRAIKHKGWSLLTDSEIVDVGLEVLEEAGWARVESVMTTGRPAKFVRLHPSLRTAKRRQ